MSIFASHLRVLPMLIGAASLLLVVKVESVWNGIQDVARPTLAITTATAAEPSQEAVTSPPTHAVDAAPLRQVVSGATGPAAPAIPVAQAPQSQQAAELSPAELDVLQQLAERRKSLDERERAIAERGSLLQAAEARIDQKIQDLRDLRVTLEQLTKLRDEQEERKILSLVKIYETMKPKDAARIFQELELETLLLVVDRMKERKLAPVLAEMNPNKAMEITVELAKLRQMPQPLVGPQG